MITTTPDDPRPGVSARVDGYLAAMRAIEAEGEREIEAAGERQLDRMRRQLQGGPRA